MLRFSFSNMIYYFSFVAVFCLTRNMVEALPMPQNAASDPFSAGATWFEQMASSINKDFKPTFQQQPNTQFQAQQGPSPSVDAQQNNMNPELSSLTPDSVWYYMFDPVGYGESFVAKPACQEQQNPGPQDKADPGVQAKVDPAFQGNQDTVSQNQQNLGADVNQAQSNPGVQGQQTGAFPNQGTTGFRNPFLTVLDQMMRDF